MSRLRRFALFEQVSEARLLALEPWLQERELRPNQTAYVVGDPCGGLYAVIRGAVNLRSERPGKPVGQGLSLGPGEVFGEAEVLGLGARELTVRALVRTTLLHLPLDPILGLLAEEPAFGLALRGLSTRRRMVLARALLAATRKEPRIWLDRDVTLCLGNGMKVAARLEDLSGGGACFAAAPESWQVGELVNFSLGIEGRPNLLQARGVVRWRDEALVGISFESTGVIHRQQVDEVLRALTPLELAG